MTTQTITATAPATTKPAPATLDLTHPRALAAACRRLYRLTRKASSVTAAAEAARTALPVLRGQAARRAELVQLLFERCRGTDTLARRARMSPAQLREALDVRVRERLAARASREIRARGGETTIETEHGSVSLEVTDRQDGMVVVRAEGWRYYSRRFGSRRAELSYLYGVDDNGPWAVRLPGITSTVRHALEAITPAAVTKARAAGKRVQRQGDVYAIETTKAHDGKGDLPSAHTFDPATRLLRHLDETPHQALHLPYPVRFVTQSVLRMGRSGGRGRGD